MKLLPLEILNKIFLQLDFKQKTECMLVCRSWADAIRSRSLLDTIIIHVEHEEHNMFERFVDRLDNNPGQCAQVKHLVLKSNSTVTIPERVLYGCFTHLDSIYFNIKIESGEPLECKMEDMKKVRQHISKIVDFGYSSYAEKLLVSGLCTRLTHLHQCFSKDMNKDVFFASLSNAPNLLHLTLYDFSLTIDILETLHSKLKQLETLVMESVNFMVEHNITLLAGVVPASSIRTLLLQTTTEYSNGSNHIFFEYAKRKYRHLENFGFWYGDSVDYFEDDKDEFSEFETKGLVSLIQHYGPQLKSLKINSLTEEDKEESMFAKMDESGCQLQKLTIHFVLETPIFKVMSMSNQVKHIQELTLHEMYGTGFYEQLSQFTSLTKLELALSFDWDHPDDIDLGHLLDTCSDRLETLHLSNVYFSIDTNMAPERQYHLKKLTLSYFILPQEFDEFLSQHFQNLRYLKLVNPVSSLLPLNLAKLHLTEFCYFYQLFSGFDHISIETLDDKKCRDYVLLPHEFFEDFITDLIDTYGISVRNVILPGRKDLDDIKGNFKVVCGSIQNIILNNRFAY